VFKTFIIELIDGNVRYWIPEQEGGIVCWSCRENKDVTRLGWLLHPAR
jgi:hypothetical protein